MTDSTDHVWSMEHIAAYVAGGLSAEEARRLELHARDCLACETALTATRHLDSGLLALFAEVRPALELQDRAVHRFRTTARRPLLAGWVKRATAALAAMIILGTVGAFAATLAEKGLPMPGFAMRLPGEREEIATARFAAGEAVPLVGEGTYTGDVQKRADGKIDPFAHVVDSDHLAIVPSSELTSLNKQSDTNLWSTPLPRFTTPTDGTANSVATNGSPYYLDDHVSLSRFGDGTDKKVGEYYTARLFKNAGTTPTAEAKPATPALNFVPSLHRATVTEAAGTVVNKGGQGTTTRMIAVPVTVTKTVTETSAKPVDVTYTVPVPTPMIPAPITAPQPDPKNPPDPQPKVDPTRRVILRSGDIEFEIESFDSAAASVTKLVTGIKGAFISTINSEKLPNGKVKGAVTLRVPPENLDSLVLDLRKELGKGGTLKGVRIGSQDVTKQFTDTESRLRAARTMEQRLLQIIKEGKGDIKTLLEAEKELGVWRTKIEEMEGELRYFSNLAALSTLVVNLTEKEIRAAAAVTETERVQAGVEVEDVDKAYQAVLAAVAEFKGRVTKSELKQLSAGQFNATLNFEVAPEHGGPMRDRLQQLGGRVARLEIDRLQQTEGGTTPTDAKAKRGDTVFMVQLYNLVNVAPREATTLQVAVADVPTAYQAIRDAIAKTKGRVLNAQINEQDKQNVTAQIDFEVRRADEATLRAALDAAGEVVARQVARAAESDNVTDSKVLYRTTLLAGNRLKPREITALTVEVGDVPLTTEALASQVAAVKGKAVDAQSTRERNGRMTAKLVYEVPLSAAGGLVEKFKSAGVVRNFNSTRDPHAADGKFATARIEVNLQSAEEIVAADAGVWPQVRRGLSYSASVLLTSLTWVVFGLCVVLPWAIIGFAGFRVGRKMIRGPKSGPATVTPTTPVV